jgi:predicted NBD/HSP70 family sugar kinase
VSVYNYKEQDAFNCQAGKSCFIKRWESDLGIAEDIKKGYNKEGKGPETIDLKAAFSLARSGDQVARGALAMAAKRLGIKIAYLVNLLNPEVVVLGGGLEEAGEDFLKEVSSTVKDWAFSEATENLKIVYSQLRENSVALGAASLVMQKVFAQL